jgi:hypothetical protein
MRMKVERRKMKDTGPPSMPRSSFLVLRLSSFVLRLSSFISSTFVALARQRLPGGAKGR